jgi:hypothetical protein
VPIYVIRVKGNLAHHWSSWFADMAIVNEINGEAVLTGALTDQAALHGVLTKVRDLGLPLLSVTALVPDANEAEGSGNP